MIYTKTLTNTAGSTSEFVVSDVTPRAADSHRIICTTAATVSYKPAGAINWISLGEITAGSHMLEVAAISHWRITTTVDSEVTLQGI